MQIPCSGALLDSSHRLRFPMACTAENQTHCIPHFLLMGYCWFGRRAVPH